MQCKFCLADNPNSAKFCRICGKRLEPDVRITGFDFAQNLIDYSKHAIKNLFDVDSDIREFTLDKFNDISLQPVSIRPIHFVNKFWLIIGINISIFLLAFYSISDIQYFFRNMFGYNYNTFRDVLPLAFIPLGLIVCFFLISLYKKIRFKLNADYIENNFVADFSRIAKACKLGLFNNKNHRILLSTRYDSIKKFDTDHLIIERYGKKGIFSIKRRKIIIPVSFDNISKFSNSVATATSGIKVVHYDIQGNKLK